MEFEFNLNDVLPDIITKISGSSLSVRRSGPDSEKRRKLVSIVDEIGKASAKAQGLSSPVTTTQKLTSTDHVLYLMKDSSNSKEQVIGLLKIGRKKLFVLDTDEVQNEMLPLCVLDFYIHEDKQRKGYGRKLFDYFLEDEKINPKCLAIDRPSNKFLSFLSKHYNLCSTIPQVNNFTVYDGFFKFNDCYFGSPSYHDKSSDTLSSRYSWNYEGQLKDGTRSPLFLDKQGSDASNSLLNRSATTDLLTWHPHIPQGPEPLQGKNLPPKDTSPCPEIARRKSFSSTEVSPTKHEDSGMNIFGVPLTWKQAT